MNLDFNLLAAGIGELLSFIVPIVFLIIYVLNHLLAPKGNRPQPRQPQRRPAERAERPLNRPPLEQAPQGEQAKLNAEIEQFLKRASQRRDDRSSCGERVARAKAPPKPPPKPLGRPRSDQVVDAPPSERRPLGSVAESVEKHLSNRGFSERAEHLADDIADADRQMEEHLQKAFTRQVGTLAATTPLAGAGPVTDAPPAAAEKTLPAAATLAGALATPQGMREAVILSEILQRPEHRW
jgi:hypothetical protein